MFAALFQNTKFLKDCYKLVAYRQRSSNAEKRRVHVLVFEIKDIKNMAEKILSRFFICLTLACFALDNDEKEITKILFDFQRWGFLNYK